MKNGRTVVRPTLLFTIMLFVFGISAVTHSTPVDKTTIVFLVRHAKKLNDSDTAGLNPAGQERATELARALEKNKGKLTTIFISGKKRTRETSEPARTALGLAVSQVQEVNQEVQAENTVNRVPVEDKDVVHHEAVFR